MPRFRFVAADSFGHVSDGTIDAATQADARNKLASNGLAVRELEEVATGGSSPPVAPRRAAAASTEPVEPLPMRRVPKSEPAGAPVRGSSLPLALSIIALVISLAAAGYVLYRGDPYSGRLSRYDFSTPENAFRSNLRMQATADLPAMIELQRRSDGKQFRARLDTARVVDSVDCRGKSILFVEYMIDAILTREIHCFERDPDERRFWKTSNISDVEIRSVDPALADRVARWPGIRTGDFAPLNGGRPDPDK